MSDGTANEYIEGEEQCTSSLDHVYYSNTPTCIDGIFNIFFYSPSNIFSFLSYHIVSQTIVHQ